MMRRCPIFGGRPMGDQACEETILGLTLTDVVGHCRHCAPGDAQAQGSVCEISQTGPVVSPEAVEALRRTVDEQASELAFLREGRASLDRALGEAAGDAERLAEDLEAAVCEAERLGDDLEAAAYMAELRASDLEAAGCVVEPLPEPGPCEIARAILQTRRDRGNSFVPVLGVAAVLGLPCRSKGDEAAMVARLLAAGLHVGVYPASCACADAGESRSISCTHSANARRLLELTDRQEAA